uniref:mRNA cap 0 methyltransferase domain-containing protein n=1 Tax=viral metagenome TaxID=1070528 RepID=A0A6C0JL18_9ZZZZ
MSSYKSTNFNKAIDDVNKLKLHNNQVKQWYLKNFCSSGKTLLDVGVGRLNDMKIWKTLDFEKFIGIEPSSDSLNIAKTRIEGDISLHQGSAQDDWGPFLGRRKASHILFNWTFHYGNTTEEDLNKVLANIQKYSAAHSRICMLAMDGDQIFNKLKTENSFTYGHFSVTKGSYQEQTPKLFGQDVIIKFEGVYGLEEGVKEFIVPLNKLIQAMDSIGFRLLYRFNFLDIYDSARAKLSPITEKISGLYNGLVFETKPDLMSLPNILSLSDNVYTRKAPEKYMKPWFPQQDEMEYMRLTSYFIPNPTLYIAIYKDVTPNPETLHSLYALEQKSFSTFMKFLPGKEVNSLLYEFNIDKRVSEQKLYCLRIFVLHKSGNFPSDPAIIPITVTSNVPEFLGSFTSKEHDKILHYQDLEMVKKLHKTRPFHGGGWEVSESSLPKESSMPKAWEVLSNLTPKERYVSLIFSGSILEILGTTVAADLDIIAWNPDNKDVFLQSDVDVSLWNGKEYITNDGTAKEYTTNWFNSEYPALYGAQSMEETIFDPRFHFYWKGLKFISLDAVIKRLIKRSSPSGYVDLLILQKIGVPIPFPIAVPATAIRQGKEYNYTTNSGQQQLLKTIQFYLKSWHNQTVSTQYLQKKLILPQIGGFKSSHSLETMFQEKDGVDYEQLKMTPEGEYSITRRADGKRLLQRLTSIIGSLSNKHVTDLTGNVGGDAILFGLHCKTVDAIEMDKENFEALENNVKVFGLDNVTLHFGDSTKVYNWYTDILYIDPPWGGPDYKEKTNLDLFLGEQRLDIFIKDILKEFWRPNYIVLKLPRNYNFSRLNMNLLNNVKKLHKFSIRTFNCIVLEVS